MTEELTFAQRGHDAEELRKAAEEAIKDLEEMSNKKEIILPTL